MITRKEPTEFRLVFEGRVPYPYVEYHGRPVTKYTIHVPTPEKLVPDSLALPSLEVARLRVFRACVAHEAGHIYLTNPIVYERLQGENPALIKFVSNLVEDYRIENFLASKWAGIARDLAFANAVSYMRFVPIESSMGSLKKVLLASTMVAFCGKVKGALQPEEEDAVKEILSALNRVKWSSEPKALLDTVGQISHILDRWKEPVVTSFILPHQDGRRTWEAEVYFRKSVEPNELQDAIRRVSQLFGFKEGFVQNNEDDLAEASHIFSREGNNLRKHSKILSIIKEKTTAFRQVGFAERNYSEFLRIREAYGPLIKSVENRIATLVTEESEVTNEPSGILDLQEAVQAVASENPKTDLFRRWRIAERGVAWAVLLDNSRSLSKREERVREIAVIFAEVLKNILPQNSWGLYAFSDVFIVLKDFDEKYDRDVASRLGGLTCGGATYLPDAIEVATSRLSPMPYNIRTLVVVTDGQPYGYAGIEEKTRRAVKDAERRGIVLLGMGIKYDGVNRYFRYWCSVDRIQDLPQEFLSRFFALVQNND